MGSKIQPKMKLLENQQLRVLEQRLLRKKHKALM